MTLYRINIPATVHMVHAVRLLFARERDSLEQEVSELKKRLAYLEAGHTALAKERDELALKVTIQDTLVAFYMFC